MKIERVVREKETYGGRPSSPDGDIPKRVQHERANGPGEAVEQPRAHPTGEVRDLRQDHAGEERPRPGPDGHGIAPGRRRTRRLPAPRRRHGATRSLEAPGRQLFRGVSHHPPPLSF